MTRGQGVPGGGTYIGTSPAGIVWVCYGDRKEFRRQCRAFDALYGAKK